MRKAVFREDASGFSIADAHVVNHSIKAAEDIADAIAVELEELPAVTDMIAATRPPLVHDT